MDTGRNHTLVNKFVILSRLNQYTVSENVYSHTIKKRIRCTTIKIFIKKIFSNNPHIQQCCWVFLSIFTCFANSNYSAVVLIF